MYGELGETVFVGETRLAAMKLLNRVSVWVFLMLMDCRVSVTLKQGGWCMHAEDLL